MSLDWLNKTAFAHRGLHNPVKGPPENSQSAFGNAIAEGYGFELDVLLSADQKAIVIHDQTLERLTEKKGAVIDLTAEALGTISLKNSSDNIPTLKQVLDKSQAAAPILIEIKGDQHKPEEISRAVYEDIKDYEGHVAIMSFYPQIVAWFRDHAPQITRGLVATDRNDGDLPEEYFSPAHQIKLFTALKADFLAYDIRSLPNEISEYCRANNQPVLTWTVRNPQHHETARKYTDNIIFENV